MATQTHDSKAIAKTRPHTGRMAQCAMIVITMPFAVVMPPLAGVALGAMVLLRWDLRRELPWWGLVACGLFLPWVYIAVAIGFLALGGTKSRPRFRLTANKAM
jgi:hypothetical protein